MLCWKEDGCQRRHFKNPLPGLKASHAKNLQVCPNVDVARRYCGCAEEDVSTVATGASDLDGVLAAMGGGAVKSDRASLVAVGSVNGPRRFVPSCFEVVRDLGEREGEECKGEKSCLAEHYCGWRAVGSRSRCMRQTQWAKKNKRISL